MNYPEIYKTAVNNMTELHIKPLIAFGRYPSAEDGTCSPVLWKILEESDGRTLMISEMCIDVSAYNEKTDVVTWEDCTLRKYMNGQMLDELFSDDEKGLIIEVTNPNPDNALFHSKGGEPSGGGKDTKDRIFLLNTVEAEKYFGPDGRACARATNYAKSKLSSGNTLNQPYWLRGPGMRGNLAAYINANGKVEHTGYHVNCKDFAIRPAIVVDTSNPKFARLVKVRMQTESDRPQTVTRQEAQPTSNNNRMLSMILGIVGIVLSLLALVINRIITHPSLPLFIALAASGFICGIAGLVSGLKGSGRLLAGIFISIVAVLLGLFLLALATYNGISHIWDLSHYL